MTSLATSASTSQDQSDGSRSSYRPLSTVARARLDVQPIHPMDRRRRFMNDGEAEVLVALAKSVSPKVVVEIGVNEGLTARAILRNVDGIESYIGVDVLPGYVTACEVQRREVPAFPGRFGKADPRFTLMLMKRGTLDLTASDLPAADLVFIDGDHGREAVIHDTGLARSIVRPGGLIVWHDYHHMGSVDVASVLEEMASAGAPIRHVEGTWLAFERV